MEMQDILAEVEIAMAQCQTMEAQVRQKAREMGIDMMMMRYSDGTSTMMPIVLAKSQLLAVLYDAQKEVKNQEAGQKIVDWFTGVRKKNDNSDSQEGQS